MKHFPLPVQFSINFPRLASIFLQQSSCAVNSHLAPLFVGIPTAELRIPLSRIVLGHRVMHFAAPIDKQDHTTPLFQTPTKPNLVFYGFSWDQIDVTPNHTKPNFVLVLQKSAIKFVSSQK